MKIVILFLALISITVVSSTQMCRSTDVKVYSSMNPIAQSFTLDVKKIRGVEFETNEADFTSAELIPIEQVGFVLEKKASSKVLDQIHHKYLRNEPESVWLPYSFVGDWSRNGFVISTQMVRTSTSKSDKPLVAFEFVNDFDLNSISTSDMNAFLVNLRGNAEKRKIIKQVVKNSILKAADSYSTSSQSLDAMKKKNKTTQQEIASLKVTLKKTIKEIITITVQETTLEQTISVKSAALSTVNDEIDDIIAKLAILTSQLKVEEKGLAETRPTDISQLQSSLKQSLLKVQYPQRTPERFLEEFTISSGTKPQIVGDNYRDCNATEAKLFDCSTANLKSSKVKRKLRRSFF